MASTRKKLVLIGNGMAGMRTVEELLALTPDLFDITVFGAEPHGNYNRILLSPVLAGEKSLDEIMINPLSWYRERNIDLRTGNPVTAIDRREKTVTAADGSTIAYDKLILATGSNPIVIPLPGCDLDGVVTFRDIKDVEAMIAASKTGREAVVIGGGLLGLEAAAGLMKRGMTVTVVHLMDILMERQLDSVSAAMLKEELEAQGLVFRMGTQTESILGEAGRVTGIRFKDGTELKTDLVAMAVGVRPNIELAEAAGLACERGILIDDAMSTSDPDIVAVGECVQHRGTVYGLVAPLFEQGRILARHLAGVAEPGVYTGSMLSTRLKVTGIDLFSAGDFQGDAETDEITFSDPSRRVYKKMVVRNNRIEGVVLLGEAADGPGFLEMMRDGTDIGDIRDGILFGGGQAEAGGGIDVAAMSDDREICGCNGVRKKVIVDAIRAKGLTTLEEVKAHTKASSSCGSCANLVEAVVADVLGSDYVAVTEKPLCGCTEMTSDAVREAVRDRKLTTIPDAMAKLGWSTQDGCPTCRQALNYYTVAFWPESHREDAQSRFINERVHANIQKDGTYSVVPRIWGGLTSPDQLRTIADVAERFRIPEVKFTGGQRITMLGVKKEDLPAVWAALGEGEMVSGHAYGKAIRTVKTCVGDVWCRFGTQNSEAMGIRLEKMLWNAWTPHKYKLAVSGCPRNCAEATIKDFGVVAVDSGWELHVGGNGGITVRVTDLLCKVETMEEVLEYARAFLQLYRLEARYLERTAPWVERIGIEAIRARLVDDPEGRAALSEAFTRAHEALNDPWRERAREKVAVHEFKPLSIINTTREMVA